MPYGSAREDFTALGNNLKLTAAVNGCSELAEKIAREGFSPATASAALAALDELAEAADHDLRCADELRDRRLARIDELAKQSQRAIDDVLTAAERDADAALSRDRAEVEQEIRRLEARIETERDAAELAAKTGDSSARSAAESNVKFFEGEKGALSREISASESRRLQRKKEAAAEHDKQLAADKAAAGKAREECQQLCEGLKSLISSMCQEPVKALVPDGSYALALEAERGMLLDMDGLSMPDVEGYRRPPLFLLGSVYVPTERKTAYGGHVVFDRVLESSVCPTPHGSLAVRMPLVRDLADGMCLVLKMTNEVELRKILRSLTLRLLLSYPPTTLNVALFDPMRNGETFAGLRGIVDLAHENVLPEVVVSGAELGRRLQSLRLRMAQHIGNYSDPLADGFFAHQSAQAIVINDFPYGFDAASLSELAKIVQSGPKLGTVVILALNPNFTKDFEDNPDFRSIMSSPGVWTLSGSGNWLERSGTRLYVRIGEVDEVTQAEEQVLETLRRGICNSIGRVYSFDEMTGEKDDESSWLHGSSLEGVEIPIGLTGGNQLARVTVGQAGGGVHHGLVGGTTGAGKSSVFHTMIMSIMRSYPASEVQLVLIDFKEGDEFAPFARWDIPTIRSVTVTTKPELALAALEDVSREWDYRASLRMDDYAEWREEHPDEFMPRLIVIFDEVQEILSDFTTPPEIRDRCLAILARLSRQGRSHGIHLFLASQSFGNLGPIMELADNMQCRIALRPGTGLVEGDEALMHAQAGAAILNEHGGVSSEGNQLVQVALVDGDDEERTLESLQGIYATPRVRASLPEEASTRLFYSSLTDNPRHPYNRLLAGEAPRRHEDRCPLVSPGLILSEPGMEDAYAFTGETCEIPLARNLLLVSPDAAVATRTLTNLALSLSVDDLGRQVSGLYAENRVILATFESRRSRARAKRREEGRSIALADLDALPCVERVSGTVLDVMGAEGPMPFECAVDELHEALVRRRAEGFDGRGCYVLVICNLGAASSALSADLQALGGAAAPSLLEKVQDLIIDGPACGIQVVVWATTAGEVNGVLGHGGRACGLKQFAARLAYGAKEEDLLALTGISVAPGTRGALALYDGSDGSRLFVAPLELPQAGPQEWLERFGGSCRAVREARSSLGASPW